MQGNGWLVTRALLVRPIRTEHAGVQDIQVFGKPQLRDITSLMSRICLLGIICSCKNTGWTDKRPVAICMVLIRMKNQCHSGNGHASTYIITSRWNLGVQYTHRQNI